MSTPSSSNARPSMEQSHHTKGLVRLTMACNERCPFCNVPMEDYETLRTPDSVIQAELDAFVASGASTLTISGGEPTLSRDRLVHWVRRANSLGIEHIEEQTNAVLIDSSYATELAAAGVTSAFVSLLSNLPDHHDVLCGLPGAFGRCLDGLDALLAAGIRVTLNPVIAHQTQDLVADYVDFVAQRFPAIRSISMSAVQPHGRAAQNLGLLPDYRTLGAQIEEARRRAQTQDVSLLNPYCGLPVCVGWQEDMEHCVEAIEARDRRDGAAQGIDNRGNKRQGLPCIRCAFRSRCGGAWHAVWERRGGAGLAAPVLLSEPWEESTLAADLQKVVVAPRAGPDASTWAELDSCDANAVWLVLASLGAGDGRLLAASRCTEVALVFDAQLQPARLKTTFRELQELAKWQRDKSDAMRCGLTWAIACGRQTTAATLHRWIGLADAMGVQAVRLLDQTVHRWDQLVEAATLRYPQRSVMQHSSFHPVWEEA